MYRCFILVALLVGCAPKGPTSTQAPPPDPMPIVIAALSSGAALAQLGQSEAITKEDSAACVAAGAIGAVSGVAAKALAGGGVLEDVTIDLSPCASLAPPAEGRDVSPVVDASIEIALLAARTILASYAPTWAAQDCQAYQRALGVVDWVAAVRGPILEEIKTPDGVLVIPAADLSVDCP